MPLRKSHIALIGSLGFLVMLGYSLARPASESLFLSTYSADYYPWVWLSVACAALAVTWIYNRAAAVYSLLSLQNWAYALSSSLLLVVLLLRHWNWAGAVFALEIWKDVYIVLLVEIFWSVANCIFSLKTARWLYGLFLAMGTVGGATGNLMNALLAPRWGTDVMLWLVLPTLVLSWFGTVLLARHLKNLVPMDASPATDWLAGFRIVKNSHYLVILLWLVLVTQVVITLIDFQFKNFVQEAFVITDERTAAIGRVYALVDGAQFGLQLMSGAILRVFGIAGTMIALPSLLATGLLFFVFVPGFLSLAFTKVASKAFDYSLFRTSKELVYMPLSYAEKTQGKAIIDVLTYRVGKAGASAVVLVLRLFQGGGWFVSAVNAAILLLLGAWCGLVGVLMRRYRRHPTVRSNV